MGDADGRRALGAEHLAPAKRGTVMQPTGDVSAIRKNALGIAN
jgi:hypothetical protein